MMFPTSSGLSGRGFESHSRHVFSPFIHHYLHSRIRSGIICTLLPSQRPYGTLVRVSSSAYNESKILSSGSLESVTPSRVSDTPPLSQFKTSTQILFRFDLLRLSFATPCPRFCSSLIFLSDPLPRWSLELDGRRYATALQRLTLPPNPHRNQRDK